MPLTAEQHRQFDANRSAIKRDIAERIPAVVNCQRRAACQADDALGLRTYFPHLFYHDWSESQLAMITAIGRVARYGGDQAIAAPRGDGKTTITTGLMTLYAVRGLRRFPLIVAASGPRAVQIYENIKLLMETSDVLAEDYPAACYPVRLMDRSPIRAKRQLYHGESTNLIWERNRAVLATIPGAESSGVVITSAGIDGAIRGMNLFGHRPDFVLIDDPETRESAESDLQISTRERTLEQDIAGLAGAGKSVARVMLCTIQNRKSIGFRFTDRAIKPAWQGERYKALVKPPDNTDLWEDYQLKRRSEMTAGDPHARGAHAFYLEHRAEMDAGAIVGNPHRFDNTKLEDGSQLEVSALQHIYNWIADRGLSSFECELQNEPPADDNIESLAISAHLVQQRLNGLIRGVVPPETLALTVGVDVGKYNLHYTAIAWRRDQSACVIDYGVEEVYNSDAVGAEKAILQALFSLRDKLTNESYRREDGELLPITNALVDAGHWDSAIYQFVRETGGKPFKPSKGFGSGPYLQPWQNYQKGKGRIIGHHWASLRQANGIWLYALDTDHWKRWVHEHFLMMAERAGSLSLWGTDPKEHGRYAKHILAEEEIEEFVPGKGQKRFWRRLHRNNHWFDATYMAAAAYEMLINRRRGGGIAVPGGPAVVLPAAAESPPVADMAPGRLPDMPHPGWSLSGW